jgi:BMFP domain-containing protein YqiC
MNPADFNKFNPTTMWRDWVAKSEQQWSEAMSTLMKDEKAGAPMNLQISQMRMMQKQFGEMMQMALTGANLPSRGDIEGVAERLGQVQDGLAALSAQMAQLTAALHQQGAVAKAAGPSRDRKPPPKSAASKKS